MGKNINELPAAATPLAGDELAEVLQDGVNSKVSVSNLVPYKKYVALLSQTGTDAPVATVLENTLGGTVVWTRNDLGDYTGTLSGAFTSGKTWFSSNCEYDAENVWIANLRRVSDNAVGLYTSTPAPNTEDGFTNVAIEIRIYP